MESTTPGVNRCVIGDVESCAKQSERSRLCGDTIDLVKSILRLVVMLSRESPGVNRLKVQGPESQNFMKSERLDPCERFI